MNKEIFVDIMLPPQSRYAPRRARGGTHISKNDPASFLMYIFERSLIKASRSTYIIPAKSIRELIKIGILDFPFDFQLENGKPLADYFIQGKWLKELVESKLSLYGKKLVYCTFDGVSENHRCIYFNVIQSVNEQVVYHAHFRLNFKNDSLFNEFLKAHFSYVVNELDRAKLVLKSSDTMFICGSWNRVNCNPMNCYAKENYGCKRCLGRFISPITDFSQIYFMKKEKGK